MVKQGHLHAAFESTVDTGAAHRRTTKHTVDVILLMIEVLHYIYYILYTIYYILYTIATTIIPTVLVYEVMQNFYHQQYLSRAAICKERRLKRFPAPGWKQREIGTRDLSPARTGRPVPLALGVVLSTALKYRRTKTVALLP